MRSYRMVAIFMVLLSVVASAATHIVWVGGGSGDIFVESNWSPAIVPSSENEFAYIAVFTNSVTVTPTVSYWYPAGITVSNNAQVVYKNNRMKPSTACENGYYVVDVDENSSFELSGTIVYGNPSLTFVKKGKGTFSATGWFGNSNSASVYWKALDIQSGTFNFPGKAGFTCVDEVVNVRSGAYAKVGCSHMFASSVDKGFHQPQINIEAGGIFDMRGAHANTVASLSGEGTITNCSGVLFLNLRTSGKRFSGRIVGGGTLEILPDVDLTPVDSSWHIASADALWGVSLVRNAVEGCTYDVFFDSNVGTYYSKTIPEDAPCFDTNGIPVEVARSGNFWYVDCNKTNGDGKSPSTAFTTLKEAMENELLSEYDTVFVAPGIYADGTMSATQSEVEVYARFCVPSNVRVVAIGSATNTAIVGASAPSSVDGGYGMGTRAVRCAMLSGGAYIRGFTLRDGRTYATAKNSTGDACYGGGIFADATSVIIDCVISNCVATRGGGAHKGRYFSCRFDSNRATGSAVVGAHLMNEARLYNCVLINGLGSCHWYSNTGDSLALNCTFSPNDNGSVRGRSAESGKHVVVRNSLVMAAPPTGSYDEFHTSIISPRGSVEQVTIAPDCTVTNLTTGTNPTIFRFAGIDDSFRPKNSRSRLVGAADGSVYKLLFPIEQYWLSIRDADGNRRMYGDELDIGAFAYDRTRIEPKFRIVIR